MNKQKKYKKDIELKNFKFKNNIKYIYIFTLFLVFTVYNLESSDISYDSKGKDFWLTFMPNFHNNRSAFPPEIPDDSLYIFITSEVPTKGKITFRNFNNQTFTEDFTITDPAKIYVFKRKYFDFELRGFNDSGNNWARNQNETPAVQTFHITSEEEVTVYALSQAVTTSDAFLVLPTDVLGDEYLVMSYNSDGRNATGNSRTPSQFVIVAVEDSTRVMIEPTTDSYSNGMNIQNITLQKGQAYLVQARITSSNSTGDLTGTEIKSNKPIAVFGGHQRATVPVNANVTNPSRDFLASQIPPIKTWGKNAFLITYVQPTNIIREGNDMFRILAAYDGTEVFINGVRVVTLDRGGFYEAPLVTPAEIQASAPILVAQFKKTAGGSGTRLLSDPFMMIIPPKEQFMNTYRVINVQVYEGFLPNAVYDAQYICLVAPENQLNGITIDGQPVNVGAFSKISSSGYSFANIPVSDGVHRIESTADIGIYVYGYGIANSYGYVGGMSFIPLDLNPPQISYIDSCFTVKGIATDSTASDFGIKELYSPINSQVNVKVNIEPFIPLKRIVSFSANLIDDRKDGKFKLIATDSLGRKTEKEIAIPGFTVSLSSNVLADTVKVIRDQIKLNKKICKDIEIKNYGAFKQYISNLYFRNNSKIQINYNTPKELLPNQTDIITVCYEFPDDTLINDTLVVEGPCDERELVAVSIIVAGDKEPPAYEISSDDCEINFRINITDSGAFDYGIEKIEILEQINCRINQNNFNSSMVSYFLDIIDPYQDAIYRFNAIDSAGNIRTFTDTIQGFTLSFPGYESKTGNFHSFGRYFIGNLGCDTLELYNYGILPLNLEKIYLSNNILFSIPQSQLPLIIEPKETKKIIACFQPLSSKKTKVFYDTLNFGFKCNTLNIVLKGASEEIIQQSTSQCDVDVILVTDELTEQFIVDNIRPLPITNEGKFRVIQPRTSYAEISLYNYLGYQEVQLYKGILEKNYYEFKFDVSNLNSGYYFLVARSENQTITKSIVVTK